MSKKKTLEPGATGALQPVSASTGEAHTFVARTLHLDHRYHDDDPIQEAEFVLKFSNGYEMRGKLDKTGKATVVGAPASVTVRFGPDAREYARVDDRENPEYTETFTDADFERLWQKHHKPSP